MVPSPTVEFKQGPPCPAGINKKEASLGLRLSMWSSRQHQDLSHPAGRPIMAKALQIEQLSGEQALVKYLVEPSGLHLPHQASSAMS